MKKIIFIIMTFIATSIFGATVSNSSNQFTTVKKQGTVESYLAKLEKLTPEQYKYLVNSYGVSLEENGSLATLAGICWRESDFGRIKSYKGCVGPYQADPKIILNDPELNVEGYKTIKEIRSKLLTDNIYAKRIAIAELKYWKKKSRQYSRSKIKNTLASYNVGWLGTKSSVANEYAEDVIVRTKAIDIFIAKRQLEGALIIYTNSKIKLNRSIGVTYII
jgi:hypothetical protein